MILWTKSEINYFSIYCVKMIYTLHRCGFDSTTTNYFTPVKFMKDTTVTWNTRQVTCEENWVNNENII